jgi:hypothetical protein
LGDGNEFELVIEPVLIAAAVAEPGAPLDIRWVNSRERFAHKRDLICLAVSRAC